jgi:hypothetical protein
MDQVDDPNVDDDDLDDAFWQPDDEDLTGSGLKADEDEDIM